MRVPPAKPLSVAVNARAVRVAVAMASLGTALGGCAVQKKPAIPWQTVALVRPIAPQKASLAEEVADVPDLNFEIAELPGLLPSPRNGPVRPHIPAPPSNHDAPPEPMDTPQIVPQLTPGQSTALR